MKSLNYNNQSSITKLKFIKLFVFVNFLLNYFSYSQVINENSLSPNGLLETILDNYGNQYLLSDIMIPDYNILPQNRFVDNNCDSGIFRLHYTTGSGMEDTTSALHAQRRAVVCQVFRDISDFINTPLKNSGNTQRIEIWIRDITTFPNFNPNLGGLASGFYSLTQTNVNNPGGIADNEIYKTIHAGIDSYTNVSIPISTQSQVGSSGLFYHGVIAINPNFNWHTDLTTLSTVNSLDLYSVVLHEVTHALGFASLIDENGISRFGINFNYFSRYDTFLRNANNNNLITTNSTCEMYNYNFTGNINELHPNCTNPNIIDDLTDCNTTLRFQTNNSTFFPIYRPSCFQGGSSLSHFEDYCYPTNYNLANNNQYFTMSNANNPGSNKRYLQLEEREALCRIGYSLSNTYGDNSGIVVANNFINYGVTACQNITIAGVNDGLNNTDYLFTVNSGTLINITNILSNDILNGIVNNPNLRFENLEDISFSGSTITVVDNNDANASISFSSNDPGMHLLRYVPFDNVSGRRGNITYIYVFVTNNCGVPSPCNLVINGDFEQNIGNLGIGQQGGVSNQLVCSVSPSDNSQNTPDYFSGDFNMGSNFSVPNPFWCIPAVSDVVNGNNSFVLMYLDNTNTIASENLRLNLHTPLLANTNYNITFNVLRRNSSLGLIDFQVLFTNQVIPEPVNFNNFNNEILFNNQFSPSSNCIWEEISINFNSGTGGQQFLYIGSLVQRIPSNNNVTSSWCYIDNITVLPFEPVLTLPDQVCINQTLDLTNFLNPAPPGGIFTGNGVTGNNFNATTAGIGTHTIDYTYTNNLGCENTITDTIEVLDFEPNPQITGNTTLCINGQNNLSSSIEDGVWSSSNEDIVKVTEEGVITGFSAGQATITFTSNQPCGGSAQVIVTVNEVIEPQFNFQTIFCSGSIVPQLPNTSVNNITGSWSPSVINNTITQDYVFTPTNPCATTFTQTVTIIHNEPLITNPDNIVLFTNINPQTTPSLLLNDTFNNIPLTTNFLNIPVFLLSPSFGITTNLNGTLNIPANLTPGTYVLNYFLKNGCLLSNTTYCKITILDPTIETNKRVGIDYCYNPNTFNTLYSIYDETTIGNIPTSSSTIDITIITNPGNFTFNTNGTLQIPSGTLPGNYKIEYTMCPKNLTTNCVTELIIDLQIHYTVKAQPEIFTFDTDGNYISSTNGTNNILTNDGYSANCGLNAPNSFSSVLLGTNITNLTVNQVELAGKFVISILGTIQPLIDLIPQGTYNFSYSFCDAQFPSICTSTNGWINVIPPSARTTTSKSKDTNSVIVFPNPTTDRVTINFEKQITKATIEVYNLIGQKLQQFTTANTTTTTLDLSNYTSGSYVVKIVHDEMITETLIIKK